MSSPDRPPEWECQLENMLGSNERCIVCGGWVPPSPPDRWIIVVGPDYIGVAHNYQDEPCVMRLDKAEWELTLPSK